jgi:hypothetical protein
MVEAMEAAEVVVAEIHFLVAVAVLVAVARLEIGNVTQIHPAVI